MVAATHTTDPYMLQGCRKRGLRALHRPEPTPSDAVWSTITFARRVDVRRSVGQYVRSIYVLYETRVYIESTSISWDKSRMMIMNYRYKGKIS